MIRKIYEGIVRQQYFEIVNDFGLQFLTEHKDFIVPAHRTADPKINVLRHDRDTLQDGCSHANYLERNPCFTEGGKEL